MSVKNSNDIFGNRTCELPVCCAVSQPTAPRRAPSIRPNWREYEAWSTLRCYPFSAVIPQGIMFSGNIYIAMWTCPCWYCAWPVLSDLKSFCLLYNFRIMRQCWLLWRYCLSHLASYRVCRVGIIDDGIVTGLRYGSSGVKSRKGQEISHPYIGVQIGLAAHPWGLSAAVKRPLHGADYKLQFSAKF